MERFGAPFTVFVTTGMLTGDIDAWWLGLATLIRNRNYIELPELGFRFDCCDRRSKKRHSPELLRLSIRSQKRLRRSGWPSLPAESIVMPWLVPRD